MNLKCQMAIVKRQRCGYVNLAEYFFAEVYIYSCMSMVYMSCHIQTKPGHLPRTKLLSIFGLMSIYLFFKAHLDLDLIGKPPFFSLADPKACLQ